MAKSADNNPSESGWKLPAEAVDTPLAPSQTDMHRLAGMAEQNEWAAISAGACNRRALYRFNTPDGWLLYWKPPAVTVTFGLLALLLLIGQFWLPALCSAFGYPLGDFGGWARLGCMLLGGLLLFIAAPLHKPAGWTPEEQRRNDADREYFRRKRHT